METPLHTGVPDRVLDSELAGLRPGYALDLGCGSGANAIKLALRGWQVTGVDFSSRGIEIARSAAADRGVHIDFQVADATQWQASRSFDLVITTFALPGGSATGALLQVAAGALAPGGVLIVAEWDASMADEWGMQAGELPSPADITGLLPEGLSVEKSQVRHVSGVFSAGDPRGTPQTVAAIAVVRARAALTGRRTRP